MLVCLLALGLVFVSCGGDDNENGGGGSGAWSTLKGTTWIMEGQTSFPKIQYEDMGGPGQYCYNDQGQQIGSNGQITFDGNSVKADGQLCYNFELTNSNAKLVITNFKNEDGMNGTYTKR